MPSELLASPENRPATLSTNIERDEIPPVDPPARSIMDDRISLSASASVSISANPAMNRMVDSIVGPSEAPYDSSSHALILSPLDHVPRAPPTPPSYSFDDSPSQEVGNDTSYGLMGTLTAQELVQQARENERAQQHSTPRPAPLLPSIYNSPFAPLASDASSRPSTANAHTRAPQFFLPTEHDISSSISSMQPPSSFSPGLAEVWSRRLGNVGPGGMRYGNVAAEGMEQGMTYQSMMGARERES